MIRLALALLQEPAAVQAPAVADPYPVYVWRQGGPSPSPAWAEAIRALGFRGTNIQGGELPTTATQLGLAFYADHLARREVFHRDSNDPAWKLCLEEFERTRTAAALLRTPSLDDRKVMEAMRADVTQRAARAAAAGARFVSITDEPSFTVGANPLDFDWSPAAILTFRERLRVRWPRLEDLKAALGPNAAPHDRTLPFLTDDAVAHAAAPGQWNFAGWNATRESADVTFASALASAAEAARTAAPSVPVGFLGGRPPGAFGGMDWRALLRWRPDVLEIYDVGAARELVRALAPQAALVDTAFLADAGAEYTPDLVPARMSWLFARGGRATILWSNAALFDASEGEQPRAALRPTEGALAVSDRARELRTLAEQVRVSSPARSEIGIVVSQPSIRAGWLFDARRDGTTWPRRFSTHEYEHSTALASLDSWFTLLEDLGYSPRAIDARDLSSNPLPRMLVLPRTLALSREESEAIRRHVVQGGFLLAEGRPGILDGDLCGGAGGALDDLFHLEPAKFVGFADENLEPSALAIRSAAGSIILEPQLRSGASPSPSIAFAGAEDRALLLNISVALDRDARLEPASPSARALRALLRPWIEKHLAAPPIIARSESGLPLAVHREPFDGGMVAFMTVNVRRRPKLALRDPIDVTLELRGLWSRAKAVRIDGNAAPLPVDENGTVRLRLDPRHLAAVRFSL